MKKCTACGKPFPPEALTAKRIAFTGQGRGGRYRYLRSRTVAHLCNDCRADDPDWRAEPYAVQKSPRQGREA